MYKFPLGKDVFKPTERILIESDEFKVTGFKYNSGVEAIKIENSKGHLVILPFMGQMIWDAFFIGEDLCMENMFSEPKMSNEIVGTYGCFAFHSGLIRNGCPSSQDDHPLHGEMPCAKMDNAWLEISEDVITIKGQYEYVMGFGDHYLATPSIRLEAHSSLFDICMQVQNLASVVMPLQYMCHMNAAYFANAQMTQNVPDEVIKLRETVPGHVKPTSKWFDFNESLKIKNRPIKTLSTPKMYDPEIVYFADDLSLYTDKAEFEMKIDNGKKLVTYFDTNQFNYATRWILFNGDQKVGAYVLPATCRPEGHLAAQNSGSLIYLEPKEIREFKVTTGIVT